VDTFIRFVGDGARADASEMARGCPDELLTLLRAEARAVLVCSIRPRAFGRESAMRSKHDSRERRTRSVLATAWGVKQIGAAIELLPQSRT